MTLTQQSGSLIPRLSGDSPWGWIVPSVRDRDCGAKFTAGHIYRGLAQSEGRGWGWGRGRQAGRLSAFSPLVLSP